MGVFSGFQKTGFNTTGNNNTENRNGFAVALGRTRSTPASTGRIFNYCNRNSPSLGVSFACTFNRYGVNAPNAPNICDQLPSDTPYQQCSPWPQFGGLQNSNNRYFPIIASQTGNILWQVTSGNLLLITTSPIIDKNGLIYIVFVQTDSIEFERPIYSFITAFNPNGTTKWTFKFDNGDINYTSSPAIGPDGTIYILTNNNNNNNFIPSLYALTSSGSQKWKTTINNNGILSTSSLQIFNNNIFIGSYDVNTITPYIYAYDFNGNLTPGYPYELEKPGSAEVSIIDGPAISKSGILYVCALDNIERAISYAFNTITQTTLWDYRVSNAIPTSRPALSNDESVVYFTLNHNYSNVPANLCAINSLNGNVIWTYSTSNYQGITEQFPNDSLAIANDGTIYIIVNGQDDNINSNSYGKLIAVDPNGNEKWRYVFGKLADNSTSSLVDCSPVIGGDGTIYIGITIYNNANVSAATKSNLTMFAITPQGKLKWQKITTSINTNNDVPSILYSNSPSISLDGTIYIGAQYTNTSTSQQNSILYAIN